MIDYSADELEAAYARLLYAVYVQAEREALRSAAPTARRQAVAWLNHPNIQPVAEYFRRERAKRNVRSFQMLHVMSHEAAQP